ncbi:MAG: putative enzyme of poly-gamma-glutamate biosynthesis (capsule formation) [Gammaproteobacteria bacterium]|nr:putative enzyme of poly-gamma-glutamate biosynthesis (capsule formation) [Gammaproteobacteria bacterium]
MERRDLITLFMTGDVMTGRGIDQVLPYSVDPRLYESYIKSAIGYVELAEELNGPIEEPVSCSYIWGDALGVLDQILPDLRIINLETSITTSDDYWKTKGIHYRMHPANVSCLKEARIDYCSLANNHTLDWGFSGLAETISTLNKANIKFAGAGKNLQQAESPAIMDIAGKGRVIVFSYGLETSGILPDWSAEENRPGVNLLNDLSDKGIREIQVKVEELKKNRDIVVMSFHWGSNWGHDIPEEYIKFAHKLIDEAHVDLIHGHSSHHARAIEIYKGKLVLYGAGDFLNDYEGIGGYEEFRSDLVLMYFAGIDPLSGGLVQLRMTPMQIKRFRLNHTPRENALWIRDTLNKASERFGTRFELKEDNTLALP